MSRRRAATMTAVIGVACCGLAWAVERWPNATIAGLSLATIYAQLRATRKERQPDGDRD